MAIINNNAEDPRKDVHRELPRPTTLQPDQLQNEIAQPEVDGASLFPLPEEPVAAEATADTGLGDFIPDPVSSQSTLPQLDPNALASVQAGDVVAQAELQLQDTIDWMRARQSEYNLPQYADFTPTTAQLDVYNIQPYVSPLIVPQPYVDPAIAQRQQELRQRGFSADPTTNVTEQQGGFMTKGQPGGWSIGGVVNQLMAIPSFLNKAGVVKFDPNAPGNVMGFTLGALGQGIAQGDIGKGSQQEFNPKNFSQIEKSALTALEPTKQGTNIFNGTFGDYGTGLLGAINYGMDNLVGGNAIRGFIADVKRNTQAARNKQPMRWDGALNALRGKDYSFLNPDGENSVLGKSAKGGEFWGRAAGGFILDAITDINPLNSIKRAALSAPRKAAVGETRKILVQKMIKAAVEGLDSPILDAAILPTKKVLKKENISKLAEMSTMALEKTEGLIDLGTARIERPVLNRVEKTPTALPPERKRLPEKDPKQISGSHSQTNLKATTEQHYVSKQLPPIREENPLALLPPARDISTQKGYANATERSTKEGINTDVLNTADKTDNIFENLEDTFRATNVENLIVSKLKEIKQQAETPLGISDKNVNLIADPVAVPTVLQAAEQNGAIRIGEGGTIKRADEAIEEAQRELIRLRLEQNRVKELPNSDIRADYQNKIADLQERINETRKKITGGRELKTEFAPAEVSPDLVDAVVPVISQATFVPAANPSVLYEQLKSLSSTQRIYSDTVNYVERSNGDLTNLARFLGHWDGSRKQALNAEQLADLRATYGSIYSPVGHPIDSKALKQYLKTGVARVETKAANQVIGTAQETRVIKRVENAQVPAKEITREDTIAQLEQKVDQLYKRTDELTDQALTDPKAEAELQSVDAELEATEQELARLYMEQTQGSRDYKGFEKNLPTEKQPTSPQSKEAVTQLFAAEAAVKEDMTRVRELSEQAALLEKQLADDTAELMKQPKLEAQPLDVGTYDNGFHNDRVLANAHANVDVTNVVPGTPNKKLADQVNSQTYFTGTKFDVEDLNQLDARLSQPTRNPLGLGKYFSTDPEYAEDLAKAAIADNVPHSLLGVNEVGQVFEVKPRVANPFDSNAVITPEVRDLFMEAAKAAGFDTDVLKSYKRRLTKAGKTERYGHQAWNNLASAHIKVHGDTPIDEAMFRQFELNVQELMKANRYDSIVRNAGNQQTLVVFGDGVDELARTQVGSGDVIEQATHAFNLASSHVALDPTSKALKVQAHDARIALGMEMKQRIDDLLQEAVDRADNSIDRMLEADDAAEAIVQTEKQAQSAKALEQGQRRYQQEIGDIIKNNSEHPGCL